MNKFDTLDQLTVALLRLVSLLSLDSGSQWTRKFESDLQWARSLKGKQFDAIEFSNLSTSIRHVYAGMGSFNDYAQATYDPTTHRYIPIPGTEDFDAVRSTVFDLALALVIAESSQDDIHVRRPQ